MKLEHVLLNFLQIKNIVLNFRILDAAKQERVSYELVEINYKPLVGLSKTTELRQNCNQYI